MPRLHRPVVLALLAVLAVGVAACRRQVKVGGPEGEPEAVVPAEPATLQVQNHHRTDVVVYLFRGNMRMRLGQVNTAATQTWTLPPEAVRDPGGVVLIADPIGDRRELLSDRIILRSGARVVWTLESGLARSSLAIY